MKRSLLLFPVFILIAATSFATQDLERGYVEGPTVMIPTRAADEWRDVPADELPAPKPLPRGLASGPVTGNKTQPQGALSGVVVYCSAGHGFLADPNDAHPADGDRTWSTQRFLYSGVVEDFGNNEQINFFAQYAFNAGATVVPFRPLGYQPNEFVLDNGSEGVSYTGTWRIDTTSTIYYGTPSDDIPYRYAIADSTGESALAAYRPPIAQEGYYPVYCWARWGSDRVNQLYRIVHSGGTAEVRVNHRRVGQGWVWLGNYHFVPGGNGGVEISNFAPGDSGVVIADAIRFGNGMGDVNRGYGFSGYGREFEASRYWVERMNGVGVSTDLYDWPSFDDWDDNIGTPPRKSADMNNEADGTYWQRIYLGFHSNAGTPNTLGLYNVTPGTATTSQTEYAQYIATEIAADLEHEDSGVSFQYDSADTRQVAIYTNGSSYGEIRAFGSALGIGNDNEMAATIAEVASHESPLDGVLLRDPRCRNIMARASYQAIVKFLNAGSGGQIPLALLPEPPTHVSARVSAGGDVTVGWQAPPVTAAGGGAATGYVVYRSTDGYGFGSPVVIAGGSNLSTVISGLAPGAIHYFQVAATNSGGESMPSETLAVRISAGMTPSPVLIVNGFDRFDEYMSPWLVLPTNIGSTSAGGATIRTIRPLQMNSFDYAIQHGKALQACNRSFDSCSNESIASGAVPLAGYRAIVWIGGEESTFDQTFSSPEQAAISSYLAAGGNLFVSGAEIGAHLDGAGAGPAFYNGQLRADYVGNDAGVYAAAGAAGSIFAGMSVDFSTSAGAPYDADEPDTIVPIGGSTTAMTYVTAGNPVAAVQYAGSYKSVYVAFPFEAIGSPATREQVMAAVMGFFDVPVPVTMTRWELR
jgi:hypothetical protein